MSEIGYCRDCRWGDRYDADRGVCDRMMTINGVYDEDSLAWPFSEGSKDNPASAGVFTAAHLGCVQFEAKPR